MSLTHCPQCGCELTATPSYIKSDLSEKFPDTWAVYGGKTYEEVYDIDPEYLIDCSKSDKIFGRLGKSINYYLHNRRKV